MKQRRFQWKRYACFGCRKSSIKWCFVFSASQLEGSIFSRCWIVTASLIMVRIIVKIAIFLCQEENPLKHLHFLLAVFLKFGSEKCYLLLHLRHINNLVCYTVIPKKNYNLINGALILISYQKQWFPWVNLVVMDWKVKVFWHPPAMSTKENFMIPDHLQKQVDQVFSQN